MGKRKGQIAQMGNSLLVKDRQQNRQRPRRNADDSFLHTTELDDGTTYNRINFQSVTEQNNLEDFLTTAEMAGKDFTAERQNIHIVMNPGQGIRLSENDMQKISQAQDTHKALLQIPRRPYWDETTSKEELMISERDSFTDWRRQLKLLEEKDHIQLTPYEKNLDFWRQLWRVIERSDVIVQIVDARNPLLFRCEDLETYVKQVDPIKTVMLLINKADYLSLEQRQQWVEYFNQNNITAVFFSAMTEKEKMEENEPAAAIASVKSNADDDGEDDLSESEEEEENDDSEESIDEKAENESPEHRSDLKVEQGTAQTNTNNLPILDTTFTISQSVASLDLDTGSSVDPPWYPCSKSCDRLSLDTQNDGEISTVTKNRDSASCTPATQIANNESVSNNLAARKIEKSSDVNLYSACTYTSDRVPLSIEEDSDEKHSFDDPALSTTSSSKETMDENAESFPLISNSSNIVSADELLDIFRKLAHPSSVGKSQDVKTVGMVGYPNVGKSSTINVILQQKRLAVSATPGRTKHLQTLYVDKHLMLCDCPGLVFPSFVATKAHLVINGILPIDELRDHVSPINLVLDRISRDILEATYSVMIPRPSVDDNPNRVPTAEEFLTAYGGMRGFMTPRGVPDCPRASRYILKDYVKGKLLFCEPPPGINGNDFQDKERIGKLQQSRTVGKSAPPQIASAIDREFFKKATSRAHSRGKGGVTDFVRIDTLQQTSRSTGGSFGAGSSLGGSIQSVNSAASSMAGGKSWKKHNNRNKKEKLRRLHRDMDVHSSNY